MNNNYNPTATPNVITTQTLIAPERQIYSPGSTDATPQLTEVNGISNTAGLEVKGGGFLPPVVSDISQLTIMSSDGSFVYNPAIGTIVYVSNATAFYQCVAPNIGSQPALWVVISFFQTISLILTPAQINGMFNSPIPIFPADLMKDNQACAVQFFVMGGKASGTGYTIPTNATIFITNSPSGGGGGTQLTQVLPAAFLNASSGAFAQYINAPGGNPSSDVIFNSGSNIYLTNNGGSLSDGTFPVTLVVGYTLFAIQGLV